MFVELYDVSPAIVWLANGTIDVLVCPSDPPHVDVSGFDKNWYVGLEGATLSCESGGNPRSHSFIWTRYCDTWVTVP